MTYLFDYPVLLGVFSLVVLALSAWLGATVLRRRRAPDQSVHEDFSIILGATLTLLGLIIGFSFSMATHRYDERRNLEGEEANAIGTAYVRADLLPAANAARVRELLRSYVDLRVRYYVTRDNRELQELDLRQGRLQIELWNAVRDPAAANPTPLMALVVAGMNDVLNAQGYVQAAWWNRIPWMAWAMMFIVAISCNLLVGYGTREPQKETSLLLVLPVIVSIAFFLIADIDAPGSGVVRVSPQNLISVQKSLRTP